MKTIKYIFFLLMLFSGISLGAQEEMSLHKCREMALQKNMDLKVAGKQLERAEAEKAVARTLRLPRFSASGTGIYLENDFEMELELPTKKPNPQTGELEPNVMVDPSTGEPVIGTDGNPVFNMYAWMPLSIRMKGATLAGVALEQPVYTGGKISAGNKMADIGIDMAGENRKLQKMNTLVEADQAYWNFVSVNEKVKLAREVVGMLAELVEVARNSYEVGMAHKNELLKAQVEYNNAALDLQKAKNGLELSRMDLCRVTGLPFKTPVIAVDTVIPVEKPRAVAEEKEDISRRPEYQLLKKNIELQNQNIRFTRAEFLPTAGIQAGYSHVGGIKFEDTAFSNTSLNVLATVNIPVFHWGEGMKKISAAKIDKEITELKLEKNSQMLELEVEKARLNLNVAYERIKLSETALEQAEENRRIARDNYEVGMETMTDLLVAQTHWQEAFRNLINSKISYRIKKTHWLKATGRLGENMQ